MHASSIVVLFYIIILFRFNVELKQSKGEYNKKKTKIQNSPTKNLNNPMDANQNFEILYF
jgi:hypothetical protein